MRWCGGAMLLLSVTLLQLRVHADNVYLKCTGYFERGDTWTGLLNDTFCFKRMHFKQMTRPEAQLFCQSDKNANSQLPVLVTHASDAGTAIGRARSLSWYAFLNICWQRQNLDFHKNWLGIQKINGNWFWDDGSETKRDGDGRPGVIIADVIPDAKYGAFYGYYNTYDMVIEAQTATAVAYVCCQRKVDKPVTEPLTTTPLLTTTPYTTSTPEKSTPRIHTSPVVTQTHPSPSTATHKPATTKPEPDSGEGVKSEARALLLILILGGVLAVMFLIAVGIYLRHGRHHHHRHHHSRRHEPRSVTARREAITDVTESMTDATESMTAATESSSI